MPAPLSLREGTEVELQASNSDFAQAELDRVKSLALSCDITFPSTAVVYKNGFWLGGALTSLGGKRAADKMLLSLPQRVKMFQQLLLKELLRLKGEDRTVYFSPNGRRPGGTGLLAPSMNEQELTDVLKEPVFVNSYMSEKQPTALMYISFLPEEKAVINGVLSLSATGPAPHHGITDKINVKGSREELNALARVIRKYGTFSTSQKPEAVDKLIAFLQSKMHFDSRTLDTGWLSLAIDTRVKKKGAMPAAPLIPYIEAAGLTADQWRDIWRAANAA
jgi:hypothetical protein